MIPRKLTILFLLCCGYFQLQADSLSTKYEVSAWTGWGHIWPHVSKVNYLQTSHLFHQELALSFVPDGNKSWHHRYNFTRYGVLFSYNDFGNEEVGLAYSLVPFYNFSLVRTEKSWLGLRLGIGLGYLTEKWDPDDNWKNIVIGSNLNASIDLTLNYQYQLFPKLALVGAISLAHFSNAKYAAPNTGINYPVFMFGLKYRNFKGQDWVRQDKPVKPDRKWRVETNFGMGAKENYAADPNKYFSANLTGLVSYAVSTKSHWGVVLDFVHDSGKIKIAKADRSDKRSNLLAYTAIGLGMTYQLKVNRTAYLFQLGTYVLNQSVMEKSFYNRLAIRHFLTDKYGVHVGIRTHRVNAQTLEVGLIYRWL